jgi:hypothetical protein
MEFMSGKWFKSYHNDTKTESRKNLGSGLYNTPRLGLDVVCEQVALLFCVLEG